MIEEAVPRPGADRREEMPRKRAIWYYAAALSEHDVPQLHAFSDQAARDAFVAKRRAAERPVQAVSVRRALKMVRKCGRGVEVKHTGADEKGR